MSCDDLRLVFQHARHDPRLMIRRRNFAYRLEIELETSPSRNSLIQLWALGLASPDQDADSCAWRSKYFTTNSIGFEYIDRCCRFRGAATNSINEAVFQRMVPQRCLGRGIDYAGIRIDYQTANPIFYDEFVSHLAHR